MITFLLFCAVLFVYLHLRGKIQDLENKIAGLEQGREAKHAPAQKQDASLVGAFMAAASMPEEPAHEKPAKVAHHEPVHAQQVTPAQSPLPAASKVTPLAAQQEQGSLEFKLGSKWFTGIGGVAVIFGVGFFLRYAVQAGLISELGRVLLGVLVGIILLGVGRYFEKSYKLYSQILTGTGLGILYVAIYASFGYYHMVSQSLALALLLLLTAFGVWLAVRSDSEILAGYSALGGFLAPMLLAIGPNYVLFFNYVTVLVLGILLVAYYKLWRDLTLGSFIGMALLTITWLSQSYTEALLSVTIFYFGLYFFFYLATTFLHYYRRHNELHGYDLLLTTINPVFFYLTTYGLLQPHYASILGLFTAVMGAIYMLLWLTIRAEDAQANRFRYYLAGIAFTFFIVAVPVQWKELSITVGWAAEALVLMALWAKLGSKPIQQTSVALFTLVLLRLLFLDSQHAAVVPWANLRVLVFAISLVCSAVAFWLIYRSRDVAASEPAHEESFLLLMSYLVAIWAVSNELITFGHTSLLVAVWTIGAIVTLAIGFAARNYLGRMFAFVITGCALLRLFFIDSSLTGSHLPWTNERFAMFVVAVIGAVAMYALYHWYPDRSKDDERHTALAFLGGDAYLVLLLGISLEINDFFPHHWFPIFWSILATIGLAGALHIRSAIVRYFSYITLGFAALAAFFTYSSVDLAHYMPLFNSRVAVYIVLALALLLMAHLLRRSTDLAVVGERQALTPWLFGLANLSLFWLLTCEVGDYFNRTLLDSTSGSDLATSIENMKRVALSVAWLIYATIVLMLGITYKSVQARTSAIILFGIVVLKVFLYDSESLSNFGRAVSYFTLGCVLLLIGYLYNRYKERIVQFLTIKEG